MAVALEVGRRRGDLAVVLLFATTAFTGAAMLFLVQPLVARLLLPSYGGSATVWSTSSLFFQLMLLLGYLYTDRTTRLLGPRRQRRLHLVALLVPLLVLPLALPGDAVPAADTSPVLWLLRTLTVMVALPFLVLATTGPLVQAWYSGTDRPRADDPYFLFAASNLGSFVGLLGYPFLLEPLLTVDQQLAVWSGGFVLFVLLTVACMAVPLSGSAAPVRGPDETGTRRSSEQVSSGQVMRWLGWSFLPSGLMLAVTSHISTDVAAIPLLWVLPLAIYLGTFVVAFARTDRATPRTATRLAAVLTVVAVVSSLLSGNLPVTVTVVVQLAMLAMVGFASHARLAGSRPHTDVLTKFYLVVAVGGALGGLLNGLVAPLVFDRVLEYALLASVIPLLLIGTAGGTRSKVTRFLPRANTRIAVLVSVLAVLVPAAVAATQGWRVSGTAGGLLVLAAVAGVGWALAAHVWLAVAVLVGLQFVLPLVGSDSVVERRRTFYGSYVVTSNEDQRVLVHGTTVHGMQLTGEGRRSPTTYYARSGPLGDVFARQGLRDVAVVGLGAGTVAAYGKAGQTFTFFEIDAEVVEVARDPRLFTYLSDSDATVRTVVGDGRLRISEADEQSFDLVVLDAFSSDAIPVHLLTEEAMRTYVDRLRAGGLLAVHISNRHFDLRPVLRSAAAEIGWVAAVNQATPPEEEGATASTWVVLAASPDDLASLRNADVWHLLEGRRVRWTDDYSSVLSVLK